MSDERECRVMHSEETLRDALNRIHERACGDTSIVYMSVADLILSDAITELVQRRTAPPASEYRRAMEEAADLVPTTWLDPLLSGPESVIKTGTLNCGHIETLLRAVAARIRARAEQGPGKEEK